MVKKRPFSRFADRLEHILSFICFSSMLGAILVQVFYRYILHNPLVWPYEFSVYCYIYIVFFGAVMAVRSGSHISFNMLYDRLSERSRHVVRIVTDIMVIVTFLVIIPSSIDFIELFGRVRSAALNIPSGVVLAVFPISIILMVIQVAVQMAGSIKDLQSLRKAK